MNMLVANLVMCLCVEVRLFFVALGKCIAMHQLMFIFCVDVHYLRMLIYISNTLLHLYFGVHRVNNN